MNESNESKNKVALPRPTNTQVDAHPDLRDHHRVSRNLGRQDYVAEVDRSRDLLAPGATTERVYIGGVGHVNAPAEAEARAAFIDRVRGTAHAQREAQAERQARVDAFQALDDLGRAALPEAERKALQRASRKVL